MLNDINFKFRYSTGRDEEPYDFFEKALSNSLSLKLGLGYFSSAVFNVLALGFARFISNGGDMVLYINNQLTLDDYNVFSNEENLNYEARIIESFIALKETFSKRDNHFFNCISYLINQNRIEIKIIIPHSGGIAHEKFGVFKDEIGNKVAFTGSLNLTASAFLRNIETIDCVTSWTSQENILRIIETETEFDEIFEGKSNLVSVYSAKIFCNEILKIYPVKDIDELIKVENELIYNLNNKTNIEKSNSNIKTKRLPHFPTKFEDPKPREYQIKAYENWLKNDKNGIFAMATGTGKTITSLNCALEEYKLTISETNQDGYYQILIIVPTIALVEQWIEEVKSFDFNNIITVYSQNLIWRKELVTLKNSVLRGKKESFVIITTYLSFTNSDFQKILSQMSKDIILIADEAHNIGSPNVKAIFRNLEISRRIALSATPTRIYDEIGSSELEQFFNDKSPYVYSFSMKEAIEKEFLMEYCYYPKLVYLEKLEMDSYINISKKLMRYFDSNTGKFKSDPMVEKLLMDRKRIIHKANDKYRVLRNIILELKNKLKYCFVYVPEGLDNEENEIVEVDEDGNRIIQKMLEIIKDVNSEITCNIYTGNINKIERRTILNGFSNGEIDVLLAMKCLDEGVDVPRAEIGIFASSTGNPRQFIQRRGRLLRKHKDKTFALIYDMIVLPNFNSPNYTSDFFNMECSIVKNEMKRVAYFASLSTNMNEALLALDDVIKFYNISLSELILDAKQ